MLNQLRTLFDHSWHSLRVDGLDAQLDVLAFEGHEELSETFRYGIEVTSPQLNIPAESLRGKDGIFNLREAPPEFTLRGYTPPVVPPLCTPHGVTTGFKRLSASRDEAQYELTLEPRLTLLDNGCQFHIYLACDLYPSALRDLVPSLPPHEPNQGWVCSLASRPNAQAT
ncbi:contractile injection system protein, VgrG/Pvc8 family [Pseudomonas sp. SCB32]|uniref:contractile injection system protein, VgrG/Pvc8 family n=1 Tax=Pseudomonas sp. SCB32 TaxID=2653853 RepID=UPI00126574D9|nr:contractile injection system protein, VgrG/Pvc8 family [Pseudomonas sp. SCB32]